jgi:hypothetical protein
VACVEVAGGHTEYIERPAGFAATLTDLLARLAP